VKPMKYEGSHHYHLSDRQMLLDIEGELSARDKQKVQAHFDSCWICRARRQELEGAIGDFVRGRQSEFDTKLPPADGPRALLKAQLAQLAAVETEARSPWLMVRLMLPRLFAWGAGVLGLLMAGLFFMHATNERSNAARSRIAIVSTPDSALTPGATVLITWPAVCAQANMKNKAVPATLQRKVFEEYGIAGADPRAYEVDYLVTPALGGADDIHNLWPHSYSATVWNARVKDALEDRLREMVCDGSLDLTQAQREIAGNWISAYKKYFHTDEPLAEHRK
jgi:hypothetical protein